MVRKYKGVAVPAAVPAEPAAPDELEDLKKRLLEMDAEQLAAYAVENGIDIGNATSQQGIHKKILAHLEAVQSE